MDIKKNKIRQKRLKILDEDEIKNIYGRPRFTYEDRMYYFTLSQPEKDVLKTLRSIKSKTYFILQLGYFKAKHLFFIFDLHEVEEDVQYVLKEHFKTDAITDFSSIDKFTRIKQQQLILKLFHFRICHTDDKQQLEEKARKAATFCGKPIFIFREIMNYLSEHDIVIPGYSFMQDTVGKAITYEQNRLTTRMKSLLKQQDIQSLQKLLENSEGLYEITQLKHEPKDFSISEIKCEIHRGKQIQPLYILARKLLPELGISNESIEYYASLVNYYSVFRLKQLNEWMSYVYLLCFVHYRFQRMHDNLINTFIYSVRRYKDDAKSKARERVYEWNIEKNQNMKKVGQVLKIMTDDSIPTHTPFQDIQNRAFAILERKKLSTLADQIVTNTKFDEMAFQWEHIDTLANRFKRYLRPILLMVDFAALLTYDPLMEAIHFIKQAFIKNKSLRQYSSDSFPDQFIPEGIKRYLYQQDSPEQKNLLVDRYEFYVYHLLRSRLESGDIFCQDSIRYRSFEDDLISDHQWQQKEKLIAEVDLPILNKPIQQHLTELEQKLETCI